MPKSSPATLSATDDGLSFVTKRELTAVYTAAPARMSGDLAALGALGAELSLGDIRCFALSNGNASFSESVRRRWQCIHATRRTPF